MDHLFKLGQVVATPAVMEHLGEHNIRVEPYLMRHVSGDWGDVCAEDARANYHSAQTGLRVLSAYTIARKKVYIITEWDRSYTTIMFADEY